MGWRGVMMMAAQLLLAVLLAAGATALDDDVASPQPPPHGGTAAAAALAQRVLGPSAAKLFTFTQLDESACGSAGPCAVITTGSAAGTIRVGGSTPVEMARGLAHYCRTVLLFNFAWQKTGGFQVGRLPRSLPPLPAPIKLQKRCAAGQPRCYSYYMNVCTESYSAWNWDWPRWQQEIDWMALSGINLVLSYTGREYVYRKVYERLGLNASAVELGHGGIEAGPAFLAFSRTENWGAYDHTTPTGPGHPNWGLPDSGGRTGGPLPDSFVHDQWAMQKKIVARQRELGIGSVLPAFQASTNASRPLSSLGCASLTLVPLCCRATCHAPSTSCTPPPTSPATLAAGTHAPGGEQHDRSRPAAMRFQIDGSALQVARRPRSAVRQDLGDDSGNPH